MAVKRGKSQARRSGGHSGGLPGWAWLVLGVVLTLGVVLFAPKFLKSGGADGFIRPKPNPDAQPRAARDDDSVAPSPRSDEPLPTPGHSGKAQDRSAAPGADKPQYDFYTVLPGQEVAMSDAELAASARAEEARKQAALKQQQRKDAAANAAAGAVLPAPVNGAAVTGAPASSATVTNAAATPAAGQTAPPAAAVVAASPAATPPVGATRPTAATPPPTATAAAADNQARYILQAGAFGASGDAEALKARIALLGLNARVESASIEGKTVYRVRMGPYGTATELSEAKGKLGNGGLPAIPIKAK